MPALMPGFPDLPALLAPAATMNIGCVFLLMGVSFSSVFPPHSPPESSVMVQQMKQCPTCHFTFADFQRVCAFDGAELVPFEKTQSLMKVAQPAIHQRRSRKPSMSLTSLAVLVVFLSAVLIGYLKSPNPSIPTVVLEESDANLENSRTRAERIAEELTPETRVPSRAIPSRSKLKRRVAASREVGEVDRGENRSPNVTIARQPEVRPTSRVYPPNPTIARQPEAPPAPRDKSPKVVAILKTTWKVLKKPFDF